MQSKVRQFLWTATMLVCLCLLAAPCPAQEPQCPRVLFKDFADHSEMWVDNPYEIETTLTLQMTELTNVSAEPSGPMTLRVAPRSNYRIIYLTPNNLQSAWHYDWRCHWMWGRTDALHSPDTVYRLPYRSGASHKVLQGFNGKFTHTGDLQYAVDFDLSEGTEVLAAREGTVVLTEQRFKEGGIDPKFWTAVNFVIVQHADGTLAEYDHLQHMGVRAKVGQKVRPGDLLGLSGNTGYSQMPHLHFVVYRAKDGYSRESFPMKFLINGRPKAPVEGESYRAP